MKKETIVIIVLASLLVISFLVLGFIGFDMYKKSIQEQQVMIAQAAMQKGYEQAVIQIMQQAGTCQPVNVWYQNQSMELVSLECLKAAEERVKN